MWIKSIEFQNLSSGLKIQKVVFDKKKILLVGNSGAGKTKILQALELARRLAIGQKQVLDYRFEMCICFEIEDGEAEDTEYEWKLLVDFVPYINHEDQESNIEIVSEKLSQKEKVIFEKTEDSTYISGYAAIPNTKESESLISQYRKEKNIGQIYRAFRKLTFRNFELDMLDTTDSTTYRIVCKLWKERKICPLENVEGINISPFDRYGIIKGVSPKMFQKVTTDIMEIYTEIFPDVAAIDYLQDSEGKYGIAIKDGEQWVMQTEVSSGMLKTLWGLLEVYAAPHNAVLLIDELENGLGVNCIEAVSDFIMNDRSDLQIIATSHHPYIINAIGMSRWLIIQRNDKKIRAYRADEIHLGRSKHDAYLQLINRLQSV